MMSKIKDFVTRILGFVKKRRILAAVIAAVLVIALVIAFFPARSMPESSVEVVSEVLSGTAETGSLTTYLISGGSIADTGAKTVGLAGSVKLTGWEVSEGDFVKEGQKLASVDKNSALSAIIELDELMDSLDSALESAKSNTIDSTISASAAGRVKVIYAEKGKSVVDTMYENGALMLLSLDGKMAVDIDAGDLTVGAALTVTLSDGTELTGNVYSISEDTATVTVSDEEAGYGDSVTVGYGGETLGTGELYIHSELKVTGYAGTVSSVTASVNSYVSSGQTLLYLTDTTDLSRYNELLEQREKLEEQMQLLFTAYETGGLYAPSDGCVTGLNTDVVKESGSGNDSADGETAAAKVTASAAASSGKSGGMKLLASVSNAASRLKNHIMLLDNTEQTPATAAEPTPTPSAEPTSEPTQPETPQTAKVYATVTEIKDNEDGTKTVVLTPLTGGDKFELSLTALVTALGGQASLKTGDILTIEYDSDGTTIKSVTLYQSGGSATPGSGETGEISGDMSGGASGGGMSGGGMPGSAGTAETETEQDYTMTETELCTLTPYETADISITVDESDISKVKAGGSVTVTLDALPGQSFDGTITEIDPVGTNDGGNTKYTANVEIARGEDMLTGMNATVTMETAQYDDILLIPVAALSEDASGVYVYTGYDSKNDELKNPVAVTTGVSDGEYVEILSGLSVGGTYYYKYADTLKYTFTR